MWWLVFFLLCQFLLLFDVGTMCTETFSHRHISSFIYIMCHRRNQFSFGCFISDIVLLQWNPIVREHSHKYFNVNPFILLDMVYYFHKFLSPRKTWNNSFWSHKNGCCYCCCCSSIYVFHGRKEQEKETNRKTDVILSCHWEKRKNCYWPLCV